MRSLKRGERARSSTAGHTARRGSAISVALAMIVAVFGFVGATAPASATPSNSADCTYEWVRSIPQSHQEYKYKKTIPAVAGVKEYKYKRSVPTHKTQHWAKYQKHVKGKIQKKWSRSWVTYSTFDWEKWQRPTWNTNGSFKLRDWSDTASPDVIEESGHHDMSATYTSGGYTYRKISERYSYRVIERKTRTVQTGSTWEYSDWTTEVRGSPWVKVDERWKVQPVPEQTVWYNNGNWTTDTPGSPWVKVDERTVQDPPIKQGPVRSATEPDRGQYPNVPWTKIPGSEVCPEVKIDAPKISVIDECGPGNARYGDVPSGNYTVVRNSDGSVVVTANPGFVFKDGKRTITYPVPVDSNEPCPQAPGTATATPGVCVPPGQATGVINFVVTNTDDASDQSADYVVQVSSEDRTFAQAKKVTLADGATENAVIDGLPAGTYTWTVTGTDGTNLTGSVVIQACDVPPPPTKCPEGTKWKDKNGNGVVDKGECEKPKVKKVKAKVIHVDKCGRSADYYYVVKVKGVKYTLGGKRVKPNTWIKTSKSKVKIKAKATSSKFRLKGKRTWVIKFTNKPCGKPPKSSPPTGK